MRKTALGLAFMTLFTASEVVHARGFGGALRNNQPTNNPPVVSTMEVPIHVRCFDWVCDRASYSQTHKPNPDYCQSPDETLLLGLGDCKDLASCLHYVLKDRGIDSKIVIGLYYDDPNMDPLLKKRMQRHAWLELNYLSGMRILDPSEGKIYDKEMLKRDTPNFYVEEMTPEIKRQIKEYKDKYESWLRQHQVNGWIFR